MIQNSTQQANNVRTRQSRAAIEQSQQNFEGLIDDYNSLVDNEAGGDREKKNASQASFPETRGVRRNRGSPKQSIDDVVFQATGVTPKRGSVVLD